MAGNILYIPLSIIILTVLLIAAVVVRVKKGKIALRKFLLICLPAFLVLQVYFWNHAVNNYVKSFLFPSKTFTCNYKEDMKNLHIPLPKRTVFHGKEDGCSPFYTTYADIGEITSFYEEELQIMKNRNEILNYHSIERDSGYWAEEKGFILELLSGAEVEVIIYRRNETDRWTIKINGNE
ncbi:hypothetical protein [Brevibacillus sp. SYSU BS000544]|uniref:hypothetical protein n=1 Tax=Brevibacillus sp. SYSU BS000544 TaxID=3416443 RepID=UPI003CE49185